LRECGLTLANLVQVQVWLKDIHHVPEMETHFRNYFESDHFPARSGGSTEFIDTDCLFMLQGVACRQEAAMNNIERITTPHSFSQAVEAGGFVFLGHQRGFGNDFESQLDDLFSRLKMTLSRFALTPADLVHVNVRLKNIQDLPQMEKRFTHYFAAGHFPARMTTTTQFVDADCLVMIDGIACRANAPA
jgi:2-iminobutanoate/2-iminopropanoate deaminase